MTTSRLSSLKFIVFALTPTLVLLLAAETTIRLKHFVAPGHEVNYLRSPFVSGSRVWPNPCANEELVYSTQLERLMPRTSDENCFRGDHMKPQKDADEYRIVFVGGSTVQDFQSNEEMMTAQFKHVLPPRHWGKRISVVNAGQFGFNSWLILEDYQSRVRNFSPDLVLYYEAWNEENDDPHITSMKKAHGRTAAFTNRIHDALYNRSELYTYLAALANTHGHWKIDVNELRRHFTSLAREVRSRGARFVFVTQVIQFPRTWKGVDTFDYQAVDALLDRLSADRHYVYDVNEISALNQRLAVLYTLDLCRDNDIPVINILEPIEALGETGRAEVFMDLGHLTVKGDKIVGELIGKRLNMSD